MCVDGVFGCVLLVFLSVCCWCFRVCVVGVFGCVLLVLLGVFCWFCWVCVVSVVGCVLLVLLGVCCWFCWVFVVCVVGCVLLVFQSKCLINCLYTIKKCFLLLYNYRIDKEISSDVKIGAGAKKGVDINFPHVVGVGSSALV